MPSIANAAPDVPRGSWTLQFVTSQETVADNNSAEMAWDGNTNTIWHTEWNGGPDHPLPHDLQINLGGVYEIDAFRLLPRQSPMIATTNAYTLYTSTNGTAWTQVATGNFPNSASEQRVTFPATLATHFRFLSQSSYDNTFTVAAEINLEGVVGSLVGPGEVIGTVYNDLNYDGSLGGEPGIENVRVTAINASGTFTDNTDANGGYSFTGMTGNTRLEFTLPTDGSLNYFEPTISGDTTVQFVDPVSGVIANAGFQEPVNYTSTTNPDVATTVFINGTTGGSGANSASLVRFPYNSSGIGGGNYTQMATNRDVGAVWGLAYARSSGTLYSASFLKRHVGMISSNGNELGNIWQTDVSTGSTQAFYNLDQTSQGHSVGSIGNDAARSITGDSSSPSTDDIAHTQIGKIGLGDIDISDDEATLYVVNLNDKHLYEITIDADGNAATAPNPATDIVRTEIPDPGCTNGAWRPFALKYYRGDVYVGGVCDLSGFAGNPENNLGALTEMTATIYRYDGSSFTSVLSFPLNYEKGSLYQAPDAGFDQWFPWLDTLTPYLVGYPQPILSDLEFDADGSMIIAFIDRFGHQAGHRNYQYNNSPNVHPETVGGGDVLRACLNSSGAYVMEVNAVCGGVTGANPNNNEGPDSGEFYDDKFAQSNGGGHSDTSHGSLALLPGSGEIIMNSMNPVNYTGSGSDQSHFRAGGPVRFSSTTGNKVSGFHIYQQGDVNQIGFAKSHGLGDIELLLDPATIEIGNRVWEDTDGNGVQDPDETGINGVTVTLTCGSDTANVITANGGLYNFSSAGNAAFINAGENCIISVPTTYNNGTEDLNITTGSSAINDLHNSDADSNGEITFTAGGPGQNDHTFDIGYAAASAAMGDITVTKLIEAGSNPSGVAGWEFTLASNTAGCTLPAPYDTTPTLTTATGANGQMVTFMGLLVENASSAMCEYTVTETNLPAEWQVSSSSINPITAVTVTADGTTALSITNEEIPTGTITIVKITDGNNDTFTFSSADADLNGISIMTTGGTGANTAITKNTGSYVISEDVLTNWNVESITFSGDTDGGSTSVDSTATIDLDDGENITVTFNNREFIYTNDYCISSSAEGFLDLSSITTTIDTGAGTFSYPNLTLPGHGNVTIDINKTGGSHNRSISAIDNGGKQQAWLDQGYGALQADGFFIEPNSGAITVTYTFDNPMGNFDLILLDIDEGDVLNLSAKDVNGNVITDFSGWRFVSDDMSVWGGSDAPNVAEPASWDAANATITSLDPDDGLNDHRNFVSLTPDVLITEIEIFYPSTGVNGRHTYSTLYGTATGRDDEVCYVDLELTKTVFPTSVTRGQEAVFTLTASNNSATDATGVQASDVLQAGLSYVSDDGAGAYDHTTGLWDIGSVGAGASKVLNITVKVD